MLLKKRNIIAVFGLLCLLLGMGGLTQKVHAEGAEFSVNPVYTDGQTDKRLGYLSIKADDAKTYPLTVEVQNLNTKQSNTFDAQLVAASTTDNGTIDYTPGKQVMVKSKAPLLPDLVAKADRKQSFTIDAGATKKVTFQVKIPKKGFKGTILGSIYVKRTSSQQSEKKGFGVTNSFAMTVPTVLSQDFGQKITPKLSITMAKLESGSGGVPQVVARIANHDPVMFGQIKMNAWITKQGQTKKLYKKNAEKLAMAPRSTFKYAIDTNNKLLPKGKYTYHVKMVSGKKTFNLKRNFTVDGAAREQVNKTLVNPEKPGINWWLWGSLGILLVLVIALIAYLIGRKRGVGEHDA